jgi:ribonuclease HII
MTDSKVMPKEERKVLTEKLSEIDPRYGKGELEEEAIDTYDTTINRLKASSDLEFAKKLEKGALRRSR